MEYKIVIFWLVFFNCIAGLVMTLKQAGSAGRSWVGVYLAILLVCLLGWWSGQPALIYISLALWLLFVLLPMVISRRLQRLFLQQRYASALWPARFFSWLHPFGGTRQLPVILQALEQAQRGELTVALAALRRFQEVKSFMGRSAIINLYRLMNRWEELLEWAAPHREELERQPQFLAVLLRACGETGDLPGLVALYQRQQEQIRKLNPPTSRDMCRLMLFAFCGKRKAVESLLAGSLAVVPEATRDFWLATVDWSAGNHAAAQQQLEKLAQTADPALRPAIGRRLSRLSVPPLVLDAAAEGVIENAAREQGHDEIFGVRPTLFSRQARATQILIALNVIMFGMECMLGGGTNPEALYRLGALFPPAVRAGEWWRLVASLFLHLGALHLAMNMFALWVLGPFVEFALGFRKYLVVYLLTGVGSMGVVLGLSSGPNGDRMTVGASGCVMGLVGATGALMLRGWLREKSLSARRRLKAVFMIVLMQSAFDVMVPQVSMTAHLSGVVIGFAITLILRDRLPIPNPTGLPYQSSTGAGETVAREK